MKTTLLAALAVICITSAARAEPETDFSVSAGGGLAYELAGLNFAARYGHVEGYTGIFRSTTFWSTPPSPTSTTFLFPDLAVGIGVRLY
jgi:hypothetical protein